jgi:hypothetical protein
VSEYVVTVTGVAEQTVRYGNDRSLGSLVVQPPIHIGEGFNDAVLGREASGVSLREVVTTNEATLLVATSSRGGLERRRENIQRIANRIYTVVNGPGNALAMMNQTVFPGGTE